MSHRINVVLSDATWQQLSALPKGERSRFVDRAVDRALTAKKRQRAAAGLREFRNTLQCQSGCAEEWVHQDRNSHK